MAELRWIKMSLFLILVLQFTAAATGQYLLSFTVRVGDEVTLSCQNVRNDQDKCDGTTWVFSDSSTTSAAELVKLGKIHEEAKSKSHRLDVTENCSLVIKKVTAEDVGRYICQQWDKPGQNLLADSLVYLSVVTMTEHRGTDKVMLNCSVSTHRRCRHTVKWLFDSKDTIRDHIDMRTSASPCNASLSFSTSHYVYGSRRKLFSCEVTEGNSSQRFSFPLQSSPEKSDFPYLLRCILVSVGLAALIITVVAVNVWTRSKGNKTQTGGNTVRDDEDEDDGTVTYENDGAPSASVRRH